MMQAFYRFILYCDFAVGYKTEVTESDLINLQRMALWMKHIYKNMQVISGGCIHNTVRIWNYAFVCMMKLITINIYIPVIIL